MKILYGESFGFISGEDCTRALIKVSNIMKNNEEETLLQINKGIYYINSDLCREIYRSITNTAAKDEFNDPKKCGYHKVPFIFENIKNLTVDFNGSEFVIDGKVTNIVISDCCNLVMKNAVIKTVNPNLHKLTVIKTSPFKTLFRLNEESLYEKKNGKFSFTGKGYSFGFTEGSKFSSWNILNDNNNENSFRRGFHPFKGSVMIKEIEKNLFCVHYLFPQKFEVGQTFHVYDCLRSDVGIFVENSKNITLESIKQHFNYSLAYVAQCSENLSLLNCDFSPDKDSELDIASLADFMQVCMCRGKITVSGCNFVGAGDDAINVHGVHFIIDNIKENSFSAYFRHPQTWGFNPFRKGDKIEFINPDTLLSCGEAVIKNVALIGDFEIKIETEEPVSEDFEGYALENVSACPELLYENNVINKVVTRGILYTSRGKCEIKNNRFIDTTMSAVLLSDDAKNWFESGMCKDVTIENNIFMKSGKNAVLILPENRKHQSAVHENINIFNNDFRGYDDFCIFAKSSDNITIEGNNFINDKKLKTVDCNNVKSDF